jgi:hypothetical protein
VTAVRELVLGAAIGYGEPQIAPFLGSLRRTSYSGDVGLIVEPARARQFAARPLFRGVTFMSARRWFPARHGLLNPDGSARTPWRLMRAPVWLAMRALRSVPLPARARHALQSPLARFLLSPNESRYFLYRRFVEAHRHERILISDVRDVVFQDDPFRHLPLAGLAVGLEAPRLTIGGEYWNARWLRRAYGEAALQRFADKPVSCSGVTYGDREAMLGYLRAMTGELAALQRGATSTSAIDQGVHNYLLWAGRLGSPATLAPLGSTLATVGMLEEDRLRLDAAGRLLNEDGSVPSIVHQYDRWPRLVERLGRVEPAP